MYPSLLPTNRFRYKRPPPRDVAAYLQAEEEALRLRSVEEVQIGRHISVRGVNMEPYQIEFEARDTDQRVTERRLSLNSSSVIEEEMDGTAINYDDLFSVHSNISDSDIEVETDTYPGIMNNQTRSSQSNNFNSIFQEDLDDSTGHRASLGLSSDDFLSSFQPPLFRDSSPHMLDMNASTQPDPVNYSDIDSPMAFDFDSPEAGSNSSPRPQPF